MEAICVLMFLKYQEMVKLLETPNEGLTFHPASKLLVIPNPNILSQYLLRPERIWRDGRQKEGSGSTSTEFDVGSIDWIVVGTDLEHDMRRDNGDVYIGDEDPNPPLDGLNINQERRDYETGGSSDIQVVDR